MVFVCVFLSCLCVVCVVVVCGFCRFLLVCVIFVVVCVNFLTLISFENFGLKSASISKILPDNIKANAFKHSKAISLNVPSSKQLILFIQSPSNCYQVGGTMSFLPISLYQSGPR